MQFMKSFTIIASLALMLSACSGSELSSTDDVQLDRVGAATQNDALFGCDNLWGWFTGAGCSDGSADEGDSVQRERCLELTNAPGSSWEDGGTWDAEKRACVGKWPSPICYGWLMNRCDDSGTDATHQCSSWNPACLVMCSKWNGMRFSGYCTNDWWAEHP
jgi:hypothetical protein